MALIRVIGLLSVCLLFVIAGLFVSVAIVDVVHAQIKILIWAFVACVVLVMVVVSISPSPATRRTRTAVVRHPKPRWRVIKTPAGLSVRPNTYINQ